jgi:DNA-binding beta-propeller fold protein YncE
VSFVVPRGLARGAQPVAAEGVDGQALLQVATPMAAGIHQVDNPCIASNGEVFLTHSGARGQRVAVSVFRVPPGGEKQDYLVDVVNATSLTFDAFGVLHVSSRFDGIVYRVQPDRSVEPLATDLGVACGIAFGRDGTLYVGDRTGTVFRVCAGQRVAPLATLPPSVAAFHLAVGPEDCLYVTGPTFGTYDAVYRIDRTGAVHTVSTQFGRPQGVAVDESGDLYVVDAVAGGAGVYRVRDGHPRELVMAAPSLVGVALDPSGGLVVSSNDTAYRLDVPLRPFQVFHS